MDNPKVSILMNCYNGEEYLEKAIKSVISQDYKNWELVFWDNLSNDNSAKIFKSFDDPRFKYHLAVRHTSLGEARALAYQNLAGDLIAILDTDDIWYQSKLRLQVKEFADPEVGLVISDTVFFDEKSKWPLYGATKPPTGYVFESLLNNYFISLETVMMRASAVKALDIGFDKDFDNISDFDLIVRLSRHHKIALVPEILAGWRVHSNNATFRDEMKFVREKQFWLEKQIASNPSFFGSKKLYVDFVNKNALRGALISLKNNNVNDAIDHFSRGHFSKALRFIFWVFCQMPFASNITRVTISAKKTMQNKIIRFRYLREN